MKPSTLVAATALSLATVALAQSVPPGLPNSAPLTTEIYAADPSAHVFDGKIYIYPSHDIDSPPLADVPPFLGSHGNAYRMRDYRVLSMDHVGGKVTVHPVALRIEDVAWATRQMWAPDAAYKNGTYYLYFPAKDRAGAFRIGVATSRSPVGPFKARPEPIKGSYSIDPAVFVDDDGQAYIYFGGLSGGQLQKTIGGTYHPDASETANRGPNEPAFGPVVARLRSDMLEFSEPPRSVSILDEHGRPILTKDADRTFFEASWLHKYEGRYYLSYSTGPTHLLAYAVGNSPFGPFTYRGTLLHPVKGWTTHQSIMKADKRWWLFYADSGRSGQNYLRDIKVTELRYDAKGNILPVTP